MKWKHWKESKKPGTGFICILLEVAFLLGLALPVHANKGVYDWAFVKLDYARQEKVHQLKSFCDRIHDLALQASRDQFVVASFDINLQFSEAEAKGPVPEALETKVSELRESFNKYYIEKYFAFYDILFVNTKGIVFYSIRKESDLHSNLLEGDLAGSGLSVCLGKNPQEEAFVDFQDWEPSSEPAAFFVEPVYKEGVHTGWIILQCAINKFNTLLAWTEDLGQTGETFLVNQEGYMLTESNFEGASTILKKKLDDRNIQAKFAERQGHRTVTDYRGFTALTSFEVFHFLGTRWLVVAKVDRDEIITQHYDQYRRYYADKLIEYLRETKPPPLRISSAPVAGPALRIDMDEFLKANRGERIHTFGISTCTGILAAYPGKFAYMAHISPKDRIYGADDTNLLGQIIKKIKSFDIYRCERRHVVFVIVATHLDSLLAAVDKLVEEGFMLSQVRVMYNPDAKTAAMSYDYENNDLSVMWRLKGNSTEKNNHLLEDARNVGEIIRVVMHSDEKSDITESGSDVALMEPK